jgi:hypothetical protein
MHKIVAIWAHPRSRSTALERVFMERGDFEIVHEPFSALYYLHEKRAEAVLADFDDKQQGEFSAIRDRIVQLAAKQQVCFKDMCYHCHDHLLAHPDFLQQLSHVFLIRDPKEAIASHYAKNPNVTLDEIGYEQQASLFRAVAACTGADPIVIRAEDLVATPERLVRLLCHRLQISDRPEALRWTAGQREEWKDWRAWHDEVAKSDGIHATTKAYPTTVDNHAKLAQFYRHHRPFYEEMAEQRLQVR